MRTIRKLRLSAPAHARPWTPAEVDVMTMLIENRFSGFAIAFVLHRTQRAIYRKRAKLELPKMIEYRCDIDLALKMSKLRRGTSSVRRAHRA